MKKITEFDTITTPDEWKLSVRAYQNQEDLQRQLENAERDVIHFHKRKSMRIFLIASAIIILSCGSVLAYDILSTNEYFAISRALQSYFSNSSDDMIQYINQSVTTDNLKLTLTRVTGKNSYICFELEKTLIFALRLLFIPPMAVIYMMIFWQIKSLETAVNLRMSMYSLMVKKILVTQADISQYEQMMRQIQSRQPTKYFTLHKLTYRIKISPYS